MNRCFASDGCVDIGEANQKWIGHMVATHYQNVSLIR